MAEVIGGVDPVAEAAAKFAAEKEEAEKKAAEVAELDAKLRALAEGKPLDPSDDEMVIGAEFEALTGESWSADFKVEDYKKKITPEEKPVVEAPIDKPGKVEEGGEAAAPPEMSPEHKAELAYKIEAQVNEVKEIAAKLQALAEGKPIDPSKDEMVLQAEFEKATGAEWTPEFDFEEFRKKLETEAGLTEEGEKTEKEPTAAEKKELCQKYLGLQIEQANGRAEQNLKGWRGWWARFKRNTMARMVTGFGAAAVAAVAPGLGIASQVLRTGLGVMGGAVGGEAYQMNKTEMSVINAVRSPEGSIKVSDLNETQLVEAIAKLSQIASEKGLKIDDALAEADKATIEKIESEEAKSWLKRNLEKAREKFASMPKYMKILLPLATVGLGFAAPITAAALSLGLGILGTRRMYARQGYENSNIVKMLQDELVQRVERGKITPTEVAEKYFAAKKEYFRKKKQAIFIGGAVAAGVATLFYGVRTGTESIKNSEEAIAEAGKPGIIRPELPPSADNPVPTDIATPTGEFFGPFNSNENSELIPDANDNDPFGLNKNAESSGADASTPDAKADMGEAGSGDKQEEPKVAAASDDRQNERSERPDTRGVDKHDSSTGQRTAAAAGGSGGNPQASYQTGPRIADDIPASSEGTGRVPNNDIKAPEKPWTPPITIEDNGGNPSGEQGGSDPIKIEQTNIIPDQSPAGAAGSEQQPGDQEAGVFPGQEEVPNGAENAFTPDQPSDELPADVKPSDEVPVDVQPLEETPTENQIPEPAKADVRDAVASDFPRDQLSVEERAGDPNATVPGSVITFDGEGERIGDTNATLEREGLGDAQTYEVNQEKPTPENTPGYNQLVREGLIDPSSEDSQPEPGQDVPTQQEEAPVSQPDKGYDDHTPDGRPTKEYIFEHKLDLFGTPQPGTARASEQMVNLWENGKVDQIKDFVHDAGTRDFVSHDLKQDKYDWLMPEENSKPDFKPERAGQVEGEWIADKKTFLGFGGKVKWEPRIAYDNVYREQLKVVAESIIRQNEQMLGGQVLGPNAVDQVHTMSELSDADLSKVGNNQVENPAGDIPNR